MRVRKLIMGLALGSMFVVRGHPQPPAPPREPRVLGSPSQPPAVVSGNDLGFRIDNRRGKIPVGRLVIRVNGEWVEVEDSMAVKRLTAR